MAKYKDVFARQEQNESILDKASGRNVGKNNFIGFTFKHKLNPNNRFQNGEINLLAGQNGGSGGFAGNRLDPLATLY